MKRTGLVGALMLAIGCSPSDEAIQQYQNQDSLESTVVAMEEVSQDSVIAPSFRWWETLTPPDTIVFEDDAAIASFIENYVRSNIEGIVAAQEQRFGISFPSIPSLQFADTTLMHDAFYNANNESILYVVSDSTKPGFTAHVYNSVVSRGDSPELSLRDLTAHEVSHHYFFQRAKELGQSYWFPESEEFANRPFEERIPYIVIAEGVGEFMGLNTYPDVESEFTEPVTDEELDSILQSETFGGVYRKVGYNAVAPILEENFDRGVDFLILNPPTPDDMKNLPAYTARALEFLRN